jgi:hypothetical protein
MLRTQIQFTEDQHRRLRTMAQREGVSIAEIVRRCVSRVIDEDAPDRSELYARAAELIGRFTDPEAATDLSSRHDDYLDEAYR